MYGCVENFSILSHIEKYHNFTMLSKSFSNAGAVGRTFVRGKQSAAVNSSTQKVVNQLSALSASRKQPKILKLCAEDLIKHKSIINAWKVFQRQQSEKRYEQLEKQYHSIENAMNELKEVSPELYEAATAKDHRKFPMELKVPTDYPAHQPWVYNYAPKN